MTDILETRKLTKNFVKKLDLAAKIAGHLGANVTEETVYAVDKADIRLVKGEVLGLVGESGCGKTTVGRMVAGILPATSGKIIYKGKNTQSLTGAVLKDYQLSVQMIFQNPFASLNPRMRVETIVGEAARVHGLISSSEFSGYVDDMLLQVGLDPDFKRRFPHQFSGGQRQRLGIARALAVKPELLVCDEAIAALDVSIQAQILNLFMDLKDSLDLTYLFISHDLSVVEHISDRVAIMYLGRVVETARTEALFSGPNHPYAQALLAEIPRLDQRNRRFYTIKGEIPSPLNPPSGCHFHPRCPSATARCRSEVPLLKQVGEDHFSACHLND